MIRDGYGKYILREAVKGVLNDKVRLDRRKKGFNAAINSLIDLDIKENREYLLDDGKVFEFIDKNKIEGLLLQRPIPNSTSKFLFNFINARIFLSVN